MKKHTEPRRKVKKGPEKGIVKYLTGEGIERLSNKETLDTFVSQGKGRLGRIFRKLLGAFMEAKLLNLDLPAAYDIFQCMPGHYDYRLGFLYQMVKQIDRIDDVVVVDGGCATGIDICYLARHYKNTSRKFIGYDKKRKMIELANERRERFELDNVEFYVASHKNPSKEELDQADLLYASSSILIKSLAKKRGLKQYTSILRSICQRIKPGGLYIEAGQQEPMSKALNQILETCGLIHLDTQLISTFKPDFLGEALTKALKKAGDPPFLGSHLLKETKFYMDVYEVSR